MRTFGGRLRLARLGRGKSQAYMARKVGVDPSTWNRWEHNKAEPDMNSLKMIGRLFLFSLDWLVLGVDVKSGYMQRLIFLIEKLPQREVIKMAEWLEVRLENEGNPKE